MKITERFSKGFEQASFYCLDRTFDGTPAFCVNGILTELLGYRKDVRRDYSEEPEVVELTAIDERAFSKLGREQREEYTRVLICTKDRDVNCEECIIVIPRASDSLRSEYDLLNETYMLLRSLGVVATYDGTPLYAKAVAIWSEEQTAAFEREVEEMHEHQIREHAPVAN